MSTQPQPARRPPDPPRMSIELTNICNLHCSYCLRDEDDLYHTKANYFSVELLRRIMRQAREAYAVEHVSFTGGEVTLHPRFADIVAMVAEEGMKYGFVTNGWHFDRVNPALMAHRDALRLVAFSIDGPTRETHDYWRGAGSFDRVIRAITRCRIQGIPFILKVTIRRDTVPLFEPIAILAARLGAVSLQFSHLLPTSAELEAESAMSIEERRHAEQEVGLLGHILKMQMGISVGVYDISPEVPCAPLQGTTCHVDWRGQLSLCCNLTGFRNAAGNPDLVADLTREDFGPAYARLQKVAQEQIERRRQALAAFAERGVEPDLYTGSPCLFCLQSFGKIPWRSTAIDNMATTNQRALPVLAVAPAAVSQINPELEIVG